MIYRAVIRDLRRCLYEYSSAVSYRPSLKTAMAAGACTRICMNECIVRANSTVLIKITIDRCIARSSGVDIYLQYVKANQAWHDSIFIKYYNETKLEQVWRNWTN